MKGQKKFYTHWIHNSRIQRLFLNKEKKMLFSVLLLWSLWPNILKIDFIVVYILYKSFKGWIV